MAKRIILFISLLFLLVSVCAAQKITKKKDKANFGMAQSLNNLGKYEQAQKKLNDLYDRYPDNKNVAVELAKAMGYGKKFDQAESILNKLQSEYPHDIEIQRLYANIAEANHQFKKAIKHYLQLLEHDPSDSNVKMKVAEISSWLGDYEASINYYNQILEKQPDSKDAALRLARIYSWYKKYEKARTIYDEIIRIHPDWLTPRREKARILGWDRKYNDSIKEYVKTINEMAPPQVVAHEMNAKYNFYNLYDSNAIEYLKKWLHEEPKNLEALFDLAQVYSRQMQWGNAVNAYNQVLKIFPEHPRAKQTLKKVNLYSQKTLLKTGIQYAEASSQSRDVDYRYFNTFVSVKKPLNENYYLTLRQDNTWFNFKRFKQVYQQRFFVGVDYYNKPDLWASVNYAHSFFREETGVKDTFGAKVNCKPTDPWTLSLSQQREEIIDNVSTLDDRLYRDNYKLVSRYRPSRRLMVGQHVMFSHYSDDNDRNAYGVDLDYYLYYEPKSLKITYRYEEYHFNAQRAIYFTPKSFHYNTVALEFRHFLNKEELFFGANDTFYTIRYAVNFDVKNEIGHEIYIDFQHDYTDTVAIHIEFEKKIYEHGDTYSKDRAMFYLKLLF